MDKKLKAAIERDNELEDRGMHGDDRKTCWRHQCWASECESRHSRRTAGTALAAACEVDRIRFNNGNK